MIRSSVFSFDESSIWDPKAIRQQLNIPEDQLNILNNIPDWSVSRDEERASRIEIDTCEHSHSTSLHISYKNLTKSQPSKKNNTKLFDEHFETRRTILSFYKAKAQKYSKSVSLFEIDKISQDLLSTKYLKSAVSLPNLYSFSQNSSIEIETTNCWPEKHSTFPDKNIISFIPEISKASKLPIKSNKIISKIKRSVSKSYIQNPNMEMIAQLPVGVPNHIDKVQTNESNFEVIIEKMPNSQNLQSSCFANNSYPPAILENSNKSDNCVNISEKSSKVAESGNCDSREKNEIISSIARVTVPNSHNPDVSEKSCKSDNLNSLTVLHEKCNTDACDKETIFSKNYRNAVENTMNSKNVNLCEKDEQNMIVANGTVLGDANPGFEDKNKDDTAAQKLAKTNIVCDKGLKSLDVLNELESPRNKLVSSNECKKISCSSDDSKMDIEYTQKSIHQKVGDESKHTKILSVKRKSESKSRSSKKHRSSREKQGNLDKRSLKKAGEICYSVEQVKSMLDIMKLFL